MQCPKCDGKTKVIDSRPYIGGVYRKRKCTLCNYQFYTEEFPTEDVASVRSCMAHYRAKTRAKRKEKNLQMKRKYVLGIDPSGAFNEGKGTTGMCLLSKTKYYRLDNVWEIRAKDFASAEQYWYEHIRRIEQLHKRYSNLVVSIEDYILYAQKAQEQIHSHFETSQLIGVIRVYCWLHEIPLYIRPAVRVKKRWSDEILVHKGLINYDEVKHWHTCAVKEGALSPHIKDSIRHAVHCMAFELRKEDDDGRRKTNKNNGLHLEEVVPNASELAETDQHAFAMLRRVGLGASDSSVILGVNLYTKLDELIQQKRSTEVTEEERKVGELENVRKGRDLEPIILNYFAKQFGVEVHKPKPMYRLTDVPCLTVNFDGVFELNDELIPVEAKFVSKYAKKYWRRPLRVTGLQDAVARMRTIEVQYHTKIEEHIRLCAEDCGIPPYYYTQVQQQLLALNAPFGYLTSLWDAGWESNTFLIPRDLITQHALVTRAEHVWKQIKGQV